MFVYSFTTSQRRFHSLRHYYRAKVLSLGNTPGLLRIAVMSNLPRQQVHGVVVLYRIDT